MRETGDYRFETIKPGRVPFPDGRMQAPHISFWIVARGINLGLNTRLYFADEADANAADPILAAHRAPLARQDADRPSAAATTLPSTSTCRGQMKRCSSTSEAAS